MPGVFGLRKSFILAVAIVSLFLLLRSHHKSTRIYTDTDTVPSQNHDREGTQQFDHDPPTTSPNSLHFLPVKSPQRPLTDLSHKPLREQLSYYFPYQPWTRFPAYIWQTWRVNPSSGLFPDSWRPFEASWTEQHPGFVHEVITDDNAVSVLSHLYSGIPDVVEAYVALPKAVLKADFFRYLILLARGGVYSDMDTIALHSAVNWIPSAVPSESYGLVIGIEADPDRPDWPDWYARRIQFCQWTIQAKPGHPVLREIVARITTETLARKRDGIVNEFDVKKVMDLTGPALWTDIIFDYFNDNEYANSSANAPSGMEGSGELTQDQIHEARVYGTGLATQMIGNVTWRAFTGIRTQKKLADVVILPITSFSPGVGQMGAGADDDPMAMVKHMFEGSWKPDEERHIGEWQPREHIS